MTPRSAVTRSTPPFVQVKRESMAWLPYIGTSLYSFTDDINNLWQELQQEKTRLKHQHEHFQEYMQHAFDEVFLLFLWNDLLHAWSCWNKLFLCLMWKVKCVVGKVPEQEEYCDFIKVITRFVLAPIQINSWSDKCIAIQIHPYFKRSLWNIIELGLALLV